MYDPRSPDPDERLVDLLACSVASRYGLYRIDLPERLTTIDAVACLDCLDDTLRDFANLTDLAQGVVGMGRRIAVAFHNRPVARQPYGPVLRNENGVARIALRLERDDPEGSVQLFAHQWAQALVRELKNGSAPGPELAAALFDALRDGLPGTAATGTAHAACLAGLGVRTRPRLHAMLVGTSFEAFIEDESSFRYGLDTNRMWREPQRDREHELDEETARARQGWPRGTEAAHARNYWRQVLATIRIAGDRVNPTEGASAIARAELEAKRHERRLQEHERQYAAITVASLRPELRTEAVKELFARLTADENGAQAQVLNRKHAGILQHEEMLLQAGPTPGQLDHESHRLAEIACEANAVDTARGAQVDSITVRCRYDSAGDLIEDDDDPWKDVSFTTNPRLPRRTDIEPELLAVVQLLPTDQPHGHDLWICPLLSAFQQIAEQLLDLMGGKGPGKLAGRSFSVCWDIDGLNYRDGMRIRILEHRGRETHAILSKPARYRDLVAPVEKERQ